MAKHALLCADELVLAHPETLGIQGEAFTSSWLECASDAQTCRDAARRSTFEEAWVASCEDMEPINLAAAIKQDDPCKRVYLVQGSCNGSLASRAASAQIDGILDEAAFVERYMCAKHAWGATQGEGVDDELPERAFNRDDTQGSVVSGGTVEPNAAQAPAGGEPAPATGDADMNDQSDPSGEHEESASSPQRVVPRTRVAAPKTAGGFVVAVASGGGGCGRSTIAAIMAALCAKAELKTMLIDADLQFGDVHRMFGIADPLRVEDVVADPARMDSLRATLALDAAKPAVLAAPQRLEASEEVASEIGLIVDAARADCDVVIVATGSLWSDVNAQVLDDADAVVFVMDARRSSLAAATHAVELCSRMGVATSGFVYAVNRHTTESLLSGVDVSCALRGATAVELPDAGREVDELLGSGYMDELLASGNALLTECASLLEKVLPKDKGERVLACASSLGEKRRGWFRRRGKR